eukprot:1361545-Prymnesium_polylepis.1
MSRSAVWALGAGWLLRAPTLRRALQHSLGIAIPRPTRPACRRNRPQVCRRLAHAAHAVARGAAARDGGGVRRAVGQDARGDYRAGGRVRGGASVLAAAGSSLYGYRARVCARACVRARVRVNDHGLGRTWKGTHGCVRARARCFFGHASAHCIRSFSFAGAL